MDELLFTQIENKIYPNRQLVGSFLISDRLLIQSASEIRPLTIGHFLFAVCRNYGRILYWAFLRTLYKLGFIEIGEAEAFSWSCHFRWIPHRRYKNQQK